MTHIDPIIPGLHARSEHLVTATRDHDRDRITEAELHEAQRRDAENLLGVQVQAGFTTLATGQLTWQDHLRPFTELIGNLSPETLVRFLDTNTFYRRPDIDGEPEVTTDRLGAFFETYLPTPGAGPAIATLPAPTAFVTAARDEEATYPDPELARHLATELFPALVAEAGARGFTRIALYDPWLAEHPEPERLTPALSALAEATDEQAPELLAHLPFVDAGPLLEGLAATGLDGVILDLTCTDRTALADLPTSWTLGLGIVDARSSIVERGGQIVATAAGLAEALDHERLLIAPTGDLQHVPETIARRKVRALGQAASALALKLGGGRS